MQIGSSVRHSKFGLGQVVGLNAPIAFVRFEHGLEAVETSALIPVADIFEVIAQGKSQPPLEVLTRVQGECIRSINSLWGVFSRSRIDLLPHQLWVCRQVNEKWPARWLVADDVGLGKTIEAGMILWPLLASGRARRVLVLCPAKLVSQWQERLRAMFSITLSPYHSELDTPRADFWNSQDKIVASLDTLKLDHQGRHKRLLEADSFDILIVDEAHRMGADEESGFTLGYRLVRQMLELRRATSAVFFTGTPHRGKDFGFFALLQLLRPDIFDAKKPADEQYSRLGEVLIRNNKALVTDLHGHKLFQEVRVESATYSYTPEESRFYEQLTEFIASGKLYANQLTGEQSRAVMLVLIAMQKLASSSVAAIHSAIKNRLNRVKLSRETLAQLLAKYQEASETNDGDTESQLNEQIFAMSHTVKLMENEEPALRSLLSQAEQVGKETKIVRILEEIETRFTGRQILFFTEYKATQAVLFNALTQKYGAGCTTFINGDDALDGAINTAGETTRIVEKREVATNKFNEAKCRFLISTEAGGEGIDLQERCHTLIHVDLPWNPMRLHQRVGRLNRYGQKERVEVLSLRNPDTVEARVWDLLNAKLERITAALGHGMDEPEDMLQLVLGMARSNIWNELFLGNSSHRSKETLHEWFDQKAGTFGGQDALDAVKSIAGNAQKFDFGGLSSKLPRVDLPDLQPFLEATLWLRGRRLNDKNGILSFLTPVEWRKDELHALLMPEEYNNLTLDRRNRQSSLLGTGHEAVETALDDAASHDVVLAAIGDEVSSVPLAVFRIQNQTTEHGGDRFSIAAIAGEDPIPLPDWKLLQRLNEWNWRRRSFETLKDGAVEGDTSSFLREAQKRIEAALPQLEHGFSLPQVQPLALFWPTKSATLP